jgi:PPOX class probable F420-dependent enzyme
MIEDGFAELIGAQRQGVLVTLRKDGWPQLSNVNYAWDAGTQTIRISTTDDRAKTANLRRDPRASFYVTTGDFWSYVVVDGQAELSAVARDPHDAAVEELIDLYRAVQGEHRTGTTTGRPWSATGAWWSASAPNAPTAWCTGEHQPRPMVRVG